MSTTTTYLTIENNLANYQKLTANEPAVKTATAYYQANIGKVTTINQFVSNYRLLSYALQAYGLGNQINNTGLIKQVLRAGHDKFQGARQHAAERRTGRRSPTPTISARRASVAPSASGSVSTTVADYNEQQLESDQGASDPGVQLALYFQRVAPKVTNGYSVLADQNLLEVVQTIFNLPATASAAQIDQEATEISKLAPVSDLQDPKKLQQLTERFTAAYDSSDDMSDGDVRQHGERRRAAHSRCCRVS